MLVILVKLIILFPKKGLKLFSNNKYGRHKISRTENVCLCIVMMMAESNTAAAGEHADKLKVWLGKHLMLRPASKSNKN